MFIKGQDFEVLQSQLPSTGNLVAGFDTTVPASFMADNQTTFKVKVKYRGNTSIHWRYPKKSWRINFKGKNSLNNLTSFDLIIPEDRGLVLEHLSNFRAKKLGLLAPDSWFVNLKINQKSQGVYYVTERIDEDFIDRLELTGTLFGEKDDLRYWSSPLYDNPDHWRTYPEDEHHPDFKYLGQLLILIKNPNTTTEELLNLVDLDNFLNWQVHSLLMASFAQENTRNNRLFYNYQIKKFQFIPWDTGSRHESYEDLDRLYHPLVDKLLSDPNLKAERNKRLKEYISSSKNQQEDLTFFENSLKQIYVPLMQDNVKFYANLKYLLDIKTYRLWMNQHFDNLLRQL